tara:strand:- start:421 stop:1299 length:879 start_codon:yes stop_codon:yes gene_type:complete
MSAKNAKKARQEKKLNESDKERMERWAKTTDFMLLKPFGPDMGVFKTPSEIVEKLIEITDKVLDDKERVDWGTHLVGQVKEEPWVSNEVLKEHGVYDYLNGMIYNYVYNSLQKAGHEVEKLEVHLDHMWVVSQYENEYNPIHFHTYCDLSSVMYLKAPPFDDRTKNGKLPAYKTQRDGMIEFVYKTACPGGLEKGSVSMPPEPGKLLIFPSNLLHTVYPFQGPGERRSIAFNSHWNAVMKDGKMYDKAMRQPIDQSHEEYKKSLRSKSEVSGFAERKQRSPDSGDSETENKV